MHNLASGEVLAFLLSPPDGYALPDWLRPFVKRIAVLRQQLRLHPLLAAELDAFLEMAGPVARPAAGAVPRIPPPAAVSVSLPLDAELLRRIRGTNFALQT
jgi:hypothetical protein